jgi:hypothetical protein
MKAERQMSGQECRRSTSEPVRTPFVSNQTADATYEGSHRYTQAIMLVEHCTSSELIADMEAKYPRRAARFAVVIPCGGGKTTMVSKTYDWMIDFDDLVTDKLSLLMDSMQSDSWSDADTGDAYFRRIRNEIFSGFHNGWTRSGGKIEQIRRDNFAYFAERGNAALQALPEDDDRCVAVHSVSMAKALGLTILATYVPDDRVVDEPTYSRVAGIIDPIQRENTRCGLLAGFKAVREDAERHGQCVTDYPAVTSLLSLVQHDWSSRVRPCGTGLEHSTSRRRILHVTAGPSDASQPPPPVPAQAKPKPARRKDNNSPCTKQTQASWHATAVPVDNPRGFNPECEWRIGVGCRPHTTAGPSDASPPPPPVPTQAKPKPARLKCKSPCTKQTQASWHATAVPVDNPRGLGKDNEKPECEWRIGVGCRPHTTAGPSDASPPPPPVPTQAKPKPARLKCKSPCTKQTQASWHATAVPSTIPAG